MNSVFPSVTSLCPGGRSNLLKLVLFRLDPYLPRFVNSMFSSVASIRRWVLLMLVEFPPILNIGSSSLTLVPLPGSCLSM